MLEVSKLGKEYETPRGPLTILGDVTFSMAGGDAAAIMGPSGSGKSTLLYILGALEPPTSGSVTLDSQNPFTLSEREQAAFRNERVGFVFQDHCLLPQCTVLENVLTPTLVHPRHADEKARFGERARELLGAVGLAERVEHLPSELSGGEKQRVALARALICDPALLLGDEPTGNLDRSAADSVAEVLLDMHRQQQRVLVVVTHNPELAARLPIRFDLKEHRLERRS